MILWTIVRSVYAFRPPTLRINSRNVFLHAKQPSSRRRSMDSLRQAKTAREVAATLAQIGEVNDPILLTIAMSSYRRVRHPNKALILFYDARRRGVELDVILYRAAISACMKGWQWERALQLLDETQQRGIKPDVILYNAAISACELSGELTRAESLLLQGKQLYPNLARLGESNEIDLHDLSAPVARTVVRVALADAQRRCSDDHECEDLIIVTGGGKHSVDNEAVLRPTILAMFQDQGEFQGVVERKDNVKNPGRVIITGSSIQRWAQRPKSPRA